jgi:anthranilate phosphoribosyltransferase
VRGPHRDIVVLNAAAALIVAGHAESLADGAEQAAAAIDSGRAAETLDAFVRESRAAADAAS